MCRIFFYNNSIKGRPVCGSAGLSTEFYVLEEGADVNRAYGSFFCYLVRNMMLTASVAAAIRSDSFS